MRASTVSGGCGDWMAGLTRGRTLRFLSRTNLSGIAQILPVHVFHLLSEVCVFDRRVQFAVTEPAGDIVGRLDMAEAQHNEYSFLPPVSRSRAVQADFLASILLAKSGLSLGSGITIKLPLPGAGEYPPKPLVVLKPPIQSPSERDA